MAPQDLFQKFVYFLLMLTALLGNFSTPLEIKIQKSIFSFHPNPPRITTLIRLCKRGFILYDLAIYFVEV